MNLYEASGHAGGRCRSYADPRLGCTVDNGNHLLLSGNKSALRYLADINAVDRLVGPGSAAFPFFDVPTGRRWWLRPSRGRFPWWILDPSRRIPDSRIWEYLATIRLAAAGSNQTVVDCVGGDNVLFRRLWEPLSVATLNTPAHEGAATLLWTVLRESFAKGEAACRPLVAKSGLSEAFVEPALDFLSQRGTQIRFRQRVRNIEYTADRAGLLDFGTSKVPVRNDESVILALPPTVVACIVPSVTVPESSQPIVNVHFRLSEPAGLPKELPIMGLIGGTSQWLFSRGDIVSITISAAGALAEQSANAIAERTWPEAAAALDLKHEALPTYSVVKEKRATIAHTPEGVRRRPETRTRIDNLFLAGDWINTRVPATLESAARSGYMAATAIRSKRVGAGSS